MSFVVQGSEEAILFTPDEVVILALHADEVDQVQVGEGHRDDRVEVLQEAVNVHELALVDHIVLPANRTHDPIEFQSTL